ncbi:hypothetical protein Bbelb_169860 [Branchiostoma belcheri]|nr:hypothetical protein Bbelb_169860 [Branchiostoma belcheri]
MIFILELVYIFLLLVGPTVCLCPNQCACNAVSGFVNCREKGFTNVPGGMGADVDYINLGNNNLTKITTQSFQRFRRLHYLTLDNNHISDIAELAFENMRELRVLNLQWNSLKFLRKGVFRGLINLQDLRLSYNSLRKLGFLNEEDLYSLQTLYLDRNNISTLNSLTFAHLHSLKFVHLEYNRLSAMEDGIFSGSLDVEHVLLTGNKINRMSPASFKDLRTLRSLNLDVNQLSSVNFETFRNIKSRYTNLYLDSNPWHCDCDLQRTFNKIHLTKNLHIVRYEELACHKPGEVRNVTLKALGTNFCVAETVTILVITITVVVAVVAAVVTTERNRRQRMQNSPHIASSHDGEGSRFYSSIASSFQSGKLERRLRVLVSKALGNRDGKLSQMESWRRASTRRAVPK